MPDEVNPLPEEREQEPRYAYRLPPCPAYDVEGIESWLSAMAGKGLVLGKDGYFAGFGIFEKTTPRALRYRLEASPKKIGALSDSAFPTEEAEELYAAYGWRYVGPWGQFFVYCADSPEARELNTDPEVQALALSVVRKRERAGLFDTCFWLLIYPALYFRGGIVRPLLTAPTPLAILTFILAVWILVRSIARVVHLHRLGKRLAGGQSLNHEKDWQKRSLRYRAGRLLFPALILVWCGFLLSAWSDDIQDTHKIPLSEYQGDIPFATVADFFPEGETTLSDNGYSNSIKERANLFFPRMLDYRENSLIALPDGSAASGALDVEYIEAISPALAREIARECVSQARRQKRYEARSLPPFENMDYAAGYTEYFPTVVLQKGTRVLIATYYGYSHSGFSDGVPYETWTAVLAGSME